MSRFARLTAQLAITAVLATGLSLVVPAFVDRREYATAVSNYVNDPSSHNEAILRGEGAKNQRLALRIHLTATAVLFVVLNAGWWLVARGLRNQRRTT
jgi:hypothetical protein